MAQIEVRLPGVTLACLDSGGTGPLALCLHGFPDTAHTWRHLAPALRAAGYRVVAPFLRGYAPSEVPADGLYQTGALARDAIALHEALGADERAVVIGHDWGAPAAYGAAGGAPGRWAKVVGLAVPPGPAIGAALLGDLDQVQRSWYMFLFQHPLADHLAAVDDHALIARLWADWSPGYAADQDVAQVRAALGRPENLAAALGYYRATLGAGRRDPGLEPLQAACGQVPPQPTLYLHGADDGCIGVGVARAAAASGGFGYCELAGAGHFCHLEQPDAVAAAVMEHLA